MPGMLRYAIKKVLIGIPVILFVSLSIFFLMQAMPGDPIEIIAGERATPQRIEELKRSWGLDQPIYIQYFYWLSHVMVGDFGISITTRLPIAPLIWSMLPYTLALTLTALVLSYVLGIPIGVMAALKRGTSLDNITVGIATFFYSMPTYWLGLMLMLTFGLYLKLFPLSGTDSMVLPALTLTLPYVAMSARIVRTEMLDVLTEDYVRTAWAKGLPSRNVILKHALRNALIPLTVMFFLDLPWIIGGAVIVESVFAWPGTGILLYKSIIRQDYPVVLAIVLIIAILTVVCNIVGDIISAVLDPRIRVEKGD